MKKVSFWLLTAVAVAGMATALVSCGDDNDGTTIDESKVDPSTIASANLIAHFPFEGDGKDVVGNLTPSNAATSTVTFITGMRGKSYKGSNDLTKGFLLYTLPSTSKLKNLQGFSYSVWLKMVREVVPQPMVFQLDGVTDWVWGNLSLRQDRDSKPDTTELVTIFFKEDAVAWKNQFAGGSFVSPVERWVHFIATYNGTTSEYHTYLNGAELTGEGSINKWQEDPEANASAAPLGNLKFVEANILSIGAWVERAKGLSLLEDEWAGNYLGQIDEFRIYDKGLSAEEAKALYDAEFSQIDE
jgi:hypothetical protein